MRDVHHTTQLVTCYVTCITQPQTCNLDRVRDGVLRSYLLPGRGMLAAPGNLLLAMLGPATFSFGFMIFQRRALVAANAAAVSACVGVSSFAGLFGTAAFARYIGLPSAVRLAAVPRQVTAPLAIAIAGLLGADPSLAATIVVLTGLVVANFGAAALDALRDRFTFDEVRRCCRRALAMRTRHEQISSLRNFSQCERGGPAG